MLPMIPCETSLLQCSGLADALKSATSTLHEAAESTGIVANLLRGEFDIDTYAMYQRNLRLVYEKLENRRQSSDERVRQLLDTKIFRTSALKDDWRHIKCKGSLLRYPTLKSAETYSDRIDQLQRTGSVALIAHLYVRYLGDLNGGQMLQRLLGKHLDKSALSFYRFPQLSDLKAYRIAYRHLLNQTVVSECERRAIVLEAIEAFKYNIELSKDVVQHTEMAA